MCLEVKVSDVSSPIGLEQAGIGSLLKQNLLYVPPNQREYAWTEREVEQLFTDVAGAIDEDANYFLGTIVTIVRSGSSLEVVDGQQRLATTSILLAAIRRYLKEVDEDVAQSIRTDFLMGFDRTKRRHVPKIRLSSSDQENFQSILNYDGEGDLPTASLPSHRLLEAAYEMAIAYVDKIVAPYRSQDHVDHLNKWVAFLEYRALVVLLKVHDDADAYRMFETLNDRGLRTSQADLIKNYLFGRADDRISEAQHSWTRMRTTLETIDEDDISVTFLRHALIVQRGYLRETDVYRAVQEVARSADTAVRLATVLDDLANSYAASFNAEHDNWKRKPNVRTAIRVLNVLNIRPITPVVLAVAAKTKRSEVAASLRFLVSLGVRLLIASSTRSGAVEVPLANAAQSIWKGDISTTDELRDALQSITPNDDRFRSAFETARVPRASLARYYLRSLEKATKDPPDPWYTPTEETEEINLEHVLPRNPEGNWPQFDDDDARQYVTRLGNLALMLSNDNSIVGSAPFDDKKPVFAQSPYTLTHQISEYPEWTDSSIMERQALMAQLAVKAWPVT